MVINCKCCPFLPHTFTLPTIYSTKNVHSGMLRFNIEEKITFITSTAGHDDVRNNTNNNNCFERVLYRVCVVINMYSFAIYFVYIIVTYQRISAITNSHYSKRLRLRLISHTCQLGFKILAVPCSVVHHLSRTAFV